MTTENIAEKKNLQLSRIFRLKNRNVTVIYVSSSELPMDVISYYYRILDLLGIDYHGRLFFVKTEASNTFPHHFSTTKLLYYSPRCIKRIKDIVKDKPCFLIPGFPSTEDIKLCNTLNCYLLSSDPIKSKTLASKSQSRRLFAASDLPVAPGAIEISDKEEMINNLALLVIKNPNIDTWVFKIDDEFAGRGLALYSLPTRIKNLVSRIPQNEEPVEMFVTANKNVNSPWLETVDVGVLNYLRGMLEKSVSQRFKICMPSLYQT